MPRRNRSAPLHPRMGNTCPFGRQSSVPSLDRPHAIQFSKTERHPTGACTGPLGLGRFGRFRRPWKPGTEIYETPASRSRAALAVLKESWRFTGVFPMGLRSASRVRSAAFPRESGRPRARGTARGPARADRRSGPPSAGPAAGPRPGSRRTRAPGATREAPSARPVPPGSFVRAARRGSPSSGPPGGSARRHRGPHRRRGSARRAAPRAPA